MPVDAHGDTSASEPEATAAAPGSSAPSPGHARALAPGDQLGRYRIERELGAGGMGLVYAAHDPDLDRRVAIKVLRSEAGGEARLRLLREARAMAKLSHRNVITVHEVGTAGGVDFVAMELLDGGSLADWLRGERRPAAEVLRRFRAAGAGLAAAHARGLVHRDFKPANVLLGHDGRVVVTDFGLARAYEADVLAATLPAAPAPAAALATALEATLAAPAEASARSTSASRSGADLSSTLTATGALMGTPAYMAPEQHAGQQAGPAADQFAFAVALWEGLTGQRPFSGRTAAELRAAVERGPPDASALPRALRPVLVRALAPAAAARWPDLAALLTALDRSVDGPRRLVRGAVVAAGVGALAGGALLYATGGEDPAHAVAPVACGLTDAEIDAAWSPAVAAALPGALTGDPRWAKVASHLDGFSRAWRQERLAACAAPTAPTYHGRLACLAGLRDEVVGAVTVVRDLPPSVLVGVDLTDVVPSPELCRTGRRAAMPALPTDPATRAALASVGSDGTRARLLARVARRHPDPEGSEAKAGKARAHALADEVLTRARALADAYPPALPLALTTKATVTQLTGECGAAVGLFEEAATAAEAAGADGMRAMARVGALECTRNSSSDLAAIQRLTEQARAAIQRAGDDPILGASVDLIVAGIDAAAGRLDQAIDQTRAARATLVAAGDSRRAVVATDTLAEFHALRGEPGDLTLTVSLLRESLAWAEQTFGAGQPETEQRRLMLGMLLHDGDPAEAVAMIDRAGQALPSRPLAPAKPEAAVTVRGRVVDTSGRPVAGIEVVAAAPPISFVLHGALIPALQRGLATTRSGPDGAFTLATTRDHGVLAMAPGQRSRPAPAGDRPLTLRIEPNAQATVQVRVAPTADRGRTEPDPLLAAGRRVHLMNVYLMFEGFLASATGYQQGTQWSFSGLPAGPARAWTFSTSPLGDHRIDSVDVLLRPGQATSDGLGLDLSGTVLDVIVRAERGRIPSAQVVLATDDGLLAATTVAEVNTRLLRWPRFHVGMAIAVTPATTTSAGRPHYQAGDIHSRLAGVPPGPNIACVIPFAGDFGDGAYVATLDAPDELEVRCSRIDVDSTPLQAVVVTAPPMKNVVP
ncbi:MAG: protein kinase [Kofleriaceae bacterium]|nr:protein kinase [Kofleriaceae bacterium]